MPMPFERIVVAFDGSAPAGDALALARRLCDPERGTLVLACVLPSRPWPLARRPHDSREAEQEAAALLADARAAVPSGIRVLDRVPVAASAAHGLTALAETERADLIAVGSSKGTADGRIGLARTAGRLLQGAPCAVAVAPPALRGRGPFRHVGIALDDSAEAHEAARIGFAIAQAGSSAVTLFSALDEFANQPLAESPQRRVAIQEHLDAVAESAPEGVNPRTVLLYGAAARVIADACDGVIDLMVCGSRGYGPVHRALLGSVSEELMARATHPVLVVPRQPSPAPAMPEPLPRTARHSPEGAPR